MKFTSALGEVHPVFFDLRCLVRAALSSFASLRRKLCASISMTSARWIRRNRPTGDVCRFLHERPHPAVAGCGGAQARTRERWRFCAEAWRRAPTRARLAASLVRARVGFAGRARAAGSDATPTAAPA